MKRLIVNADDFGLTEGVNRAIIECHQRGIVTSATLMANSAAFEDAIRLARENPKLSVGCHVTLMDGEPLLARSQVASLLCDGREFYRTIAAFAPRALLGRFKGSEIEAEATAQFEKIQRAGITISHFDAHKHAHMFPSIAEPLLRAAETCGVPAVRNPFEPAASAAFGFVLRDSRLVIRWAEVTALRLFRSRFLKLARRYGRQATDGSLGIMGTGLMDIDLFAKSLAHAEPGTWEFVCHPGDDRDEALRSVRTKLQDSRAIEREFLTSESARKILHHNGIQLISFNELTTAN
jgi:predicted glycoside hydrolase/deacetylase ChbG (UPF0249 family)